jgi:hypothetical protein
MNTVLLMLVPCIEFAISDNFYSGRTLILTIAVEQYRDRRARPYSYGIFKMPLLFVLTLAEVGAGVRRQGLALSIGLN